MLVTFSSATDTPCGSDWIALGVARWVENLLVSAECSKLGAGLSTGGCGLSGRGFAVTDGISLSVPEGRLPDVAVLGRELAE